MRFPPWKISEAMRNWPPAIHLLMYLLLIAGTSLTSFPAISAVHLSELMEKGTLELIEAGQISYLHDPINQLKASDLLEKESRWLNSAPVSDRQPNIGYRTGTTWGRFLLQNDTGSDQELWLLLSIPRTQHIAVYRPDSNGNLTVSRTGSSLPLSLRALPVRENLVPLTLAAGEQLPVVFSIQTGTSLSLRAELWDPSRYLALASRTELVRNLINGVNLALLVFGILLLAITRDRLFFLFSGYVLFFSLYVLSFNGQARILLWPEAGDWGTRAIVFFNCVSLIFLIALVRGFLESHRQLPMAVRGFFRLEQLACLVFAVGIFLFPYRVGGIGSTAVWLAFAVVVPPLAAVRWLQGQREARVVLLGWGFFSIFAVLVSLEVFGVIPESDAAVYLHFSMVALALAMALALGDRLTQLRRERAEAQNRALEAERGNRKVLEARVAERTRKLEIAKKEAEEANARKSTFLAVANHELRTPLTTILGSLELMALNPENAQDKESTGQLVQSIRMAGTHLQALIDNILDFSRLEAGPPRASQRPFLPTRLAEEAVGPFLALAEARGLKFTRRLPDQTPWLLGDPDRLRQVLINLLGNAFKYTVCGQVSLELTLTQGTGTGETELQWAVADTGPGIAPEHQNDLFEPFKRHEPGARSAQQGIGLGLPISQAILQGMGASLTLESKPGKGSRFGFSLRLPLASPADRTEPRAFKPSPLNILLVEDHDTNREIIRQLLEADEHRVWMACDAPAAITEWEVARRDNRAFDLLLLDIRLPGMDGPELARRILQASEAPPLIIGLSASNTPAVEKQTREAGMAGLCSKPLDMPSLYALLPTEWQTVETKPRLPAKKPAPDAMIDEEFLKEVEALVGQAGMQDLWQRYLSRSHAQHQRISNQLGPDGLKPEALANAFHQLANTAAGLGLTSLKTHCLHLEALSWTKDSEALEKAWQAYLDDWEKTRQQWMRRVLST